MPNTINISKNMRFFVYIIGTKHPKVRTYVGWSNDVKKRLKAHNESKGCLLYTSPSPRDATLSRMPSSA